MSRQPHNAAEIVVEPGPLPEAHVHLLAGEKEAKSLESEMAFTAGKIASRIETALFYETVSQKIAVEAYIELKQNKAFHALTYRDADGKAKNISSLDEFCQVFLRTSQRRVQQLVSNYHTIGADLYDAAEQLGFRQKDYAALKALPADDQEVIKQAIAADSRDDVLNLLQEMAARHASEKAALQAEAAEAKETAQARDSVIQGKQKVIATLEEDLHKARHRLSIATPDDIGKQLCEETAGIGWSVVGLVNVDLARAFAALDEHAQANDCSHAEFMSGVLFEIERALAAIREDYAVKARPDGDERPDWTRPDFVPTPNPDMEEALKRFEREHGYNPIAKAGNA